MNNQDNKVEAKEGLQQNGAPQPLNVPNASVNVEAAMTSGEVSEIAKSAVEVDAGVQSGGGQSQAQDDKGSGDEGQTRESRDILRERLLMQAPSEPIMRNEIKKSLLQKKERLEVEVKKHKNKGSYHALSLALMQLRLVLRQLEDFARMSYEALKDLWLKVVHNFG